MRTIDINKRKVSYKAEVLMVEVKQQTTKFYERDLELERKLKKKKWFLQRLINFCWFMKYISIAWWHPVEIQVPDQSNSTKIRKVNMPVNSLFLEPWNVLYIWRQKKETNKPTLTSNLKVCQIKSSKFIMGVPNNYLLKIWKGIGM